MLLSAALIVHAVAIALAVAFVRRPAACRIATFGGAAFASALIVAAAVQALYSGGVDHRVLATHAATGFGFSLTIDGLSAWFLLIQGVVALPVAIYSIPYMRHAVSSARTPVVGIAFNVLLASVALVLVSGEVVGFVFAWEVMSLATTALVAIEHEHAANRRAAYLYLAMSHVGTGCVIAAFLTLAAGAGSLAFSDMLTGHVVTGSARTAVFVLFAVGFGVKAGLLPVHVWLPEAHPAAPSSISAFMSGVLVKTGIYGIVRFGVVGLGVPDPSWGLAFLFLGALTAILGVLYALAQQDLKRLLAYSTIENAGIIVIGLGAAMMASGAGRPDLAAFGLTASLLHALNHAVFKGLLFLSTGSVVMTTGSRDIESFGGLLRRMPWTGACFLMGALAISGIPPLNGFTSEWLTFQSLLLNFSSVPGLVRLNFPVGAALLALTSALAAACYVKAFGATFLAQPRSSAATQADDVPWLMVMPQVVLALACVGLGLFPGPALGALHRVVGALPGSAGGAAVGAGAFTMSAGRPAIDVVRPLIVGFALLAALAVARALTWRRWSHVRRTATWGCGGALTADTEYTGTAFSKPLIMIFGAVYRPTREVAALTHGSLYFPHAVRYRARIEPTFERFLYAPLTRTVLWLAERMKVLQAGSLHAYLAYILALGVGLLIWLGGTR